MSDSYLPEGPTRDDIESNNVARVQAFLEQGGDPNFDDGKLIRSAAGTGNATMLKLLLDYCGDPNVEDGDALHLAAMSGAANTVKMLCEAGADISTSDGRAINWAAFSGDQATIETLLDHGASPSDIKEPKPSVTAIIQAYRLRKHPDIKAQPNRSSPGL